MHYSVDMIQAVSAKAPKGYGKERGGIVREGKNPKYMDCAWIAEGDTCDKCPLSDCDYKRRK